MATEHYYVDPINGSDTNVGGQGRSKDLAWQSYQWAADNATTSGSNAYVWFRPGTYSISAVIDIDINSGGGLGDKIYFVGDKFGQIWGTAGTVKIVSSTGTLGIMMYINSKDYITVKNFEIIPDKSGIYINTADYINTENCFIHDNVATTLVNIFGIQVVSSITCTIKNCTISDLKADPATSSIYALSLANSSVNIYYNMITNIIGNINNNATACIVLYHNDSSTPYLNATLKGNIFKKVSAQLLYLSFTNGLSNATIVSDYNNFYKDGALLCARKAVYIGSWAYTNYTDLSDWKLNADFNPDAHSIDSEPKIENVSGTVATLDSQLFDDYTFGYDSNNQYRAVRFLTGSVVNSFESFRTYITKVGSPIQQISLTLYTDNAGVLGTLVPNSSMTLVAGSVVTGYNAFVLDSVSSLSLTANTYYWIKFYTSQQDNSHYYKLWLSDTVIGEKYATSTDGITWGYGSGQGFDYNVIGRLRASTGTINDFKVKSQSPCINKVPYISDAAEDAFGKPRLKGNNDIGAHQYNEIKIS